MNIEQWFQVWNELTTPPEKKHILDEMIGNIPEMYDPPNALVIMVFIPMLIWRKED